MYVFNLISFSFEIGLRETEERSRAKSHVGADGILPLSHLIEENFWVMLQLVELLRIAKHVHGK